MPRSTDLHAALKVFNDAAYATARAANAAGNDELHMECRNVAFWLDQELDQAELHAARTADAMHEVAE